MTAHANPAAPIRPGAGDPPSLALIGACWLAIGLAWGPAVFLMEPGDQDLAALGGAMVLSIASFLPWMAVTPSILRWSALADLRRRPFRDGALLAGAMLAILPLVTLAGRVCTLLAGRFVGIDSQPGTLADWLRAVTITSLFALPTALAVVAVGLILAASRRATERDRLLERARLDALRAELNPHFLFNSLGGIAQLAHQSPDAAERAIGSLSDILRATLAEKRPLRPLADEISAVRDHLDLHAALIGGIALDLRIDPQAWLAQVPSHVLTPLVENATTHGSATPDGAFAITIEAMREGAWLTVILANPCSAIAAPSSGLGSGISHVRARLKLLCGPAAAVTGEREGAVFRVIVRVPFVGAQTDD